MSFDRPKRDDNLKKPNQNYVVYEALHLHNQYTWVMNDFV